MDVFLVFVGVLRENHKDLELGTPRFETNFCNLRARTRPDLGLQLDPVNDRLIP